MRRGPDLHVRRLLRELNRAPAAKRVVEAVAAQRGIAVVLLLQSSRGTAAVAQTRQLAMYLLHVGLSLTYREVGNLFGRDRSTVSYACALIEDLREENSPFESEISTLEHWLHAGPMEEEQRHAG